MIPKLKKKLLQKTRSEKRLFLFTLDIILITLILWSSYSIIAVNAVSPDKINLLSYIAVVLVSIPIFIKFGLYRSVLRYIPSQAFIRIFVATLLSTIIWIGISTLLLKSTTDPAIALIYWLGTFTVLTAIRLTAQLWLYGDISQLTSGKKVLIYGAGAAGTQLANVLKTDSSYSLVGFTDDDITLKGWDKLGLNIYSTERLVELIEKYSIDEIILAIPSATTARRREILNQLETLAVNIRSIPAFSDLASGKLHASDIKDIDIDDLLGREAVKPDETLLPANIKNKVVLVTGAGGSIGSELCRQIIHLSPKKLILLEQSEFALYQIEQELEDVIRKNALHIPLVKVLGSITNLALLENLFKHNDIQTIYHAAAYKHVPLVEENPVAGLSNNVFGTKLLAEYAMDAKAETFILISTDKAVRPTNVMGCSKRVAEMTLQVLAEKPSCKTTFTMVRFGNVLGSSGSVVPKFRQQISDGGPITVTHKEITRYFMSIPEAVQLVIQAGAMAKGGDVFVLDMGKSVKILDLATKMIKLSGLAVRDDNNPEGDIVIEYSGLRPGEKLYEELLIGDNVSGTQHPRIMRANEVYKSWPELLVQLDSLQKAMQSENVDSIKTELAKLVDGYRPWTKKENKVIDSHQKNIIAINV